jgi:exodeoxyribonuclease VII large subunit
LRRDLGQPLEDEPLFERDARNEPAVTERLRPDRLERQAPVVLSVAELDRRLKRIVEGGTEDARVEGEVSGAREVASGHVYFTLKDEREEAAIDAVLYRTAGPRARRLLVDGARVIVRGRATIWAPRGKLQFSATDVEPVGRGALLEALERLKEKLAGEGLFDPERKRPLPKSPRVIGVVTSPDGAVLHDIVKVAWRRAGVRIILARAPVQGAGAGPRLARALTTLARVPEVEAIILARGGGSADDLAAFNEEGLARAVAACAVPVVSAIGHQVDFTLVDLVADQRAATPSQAAELLVADDAERAVTLARAAERLTRAMRQRLRLERTELSALVAPLASPERVLADKAQLVDDLTARLTRAVERDLSARKIASSRVAERLAARDPRAVIARSRAAIGPLAVRLDAAAKRRLERARADVARAASRLDALSPLRVLARGYAIVTDDQGRALRASDDVDVGDTVTARLDQGRVVARVISKEND